MSVTGSSDRATTPVDKFVGRRVRDRRVEIKMSQERLAEIVGVSFQQLQKYEAGANRIGASRLFALAEALEAPIGYFFGETTESGPAQEVDELRTLSGVLKDRTAFEIVESFAKIDDHHLRRQVVEVLDAFCEKARRDDRRLHRQR